MGWPKFGIGATLKTTVESSISKSRSFNIEASRTTTRSVSDETQVRLTVPKNKDVTINLMRSKQDIIYIWKGIFETVGKYELEWEYGGTEPHRLAQDVTTALTTSSRKVFAFGTWSYPNVDTLKVLVTVHEKDISDQNKISAMQKTYCVHSPGTIKECDIEELNM